MALVSKINREFFFQVVVKSNLFLKLKQSQVDGMNAILDEWEKNYSNQDKRWLAYMLATAYHETAITMKAIEEWGKGKNLPYGKPDPITGKVYYGRGFVQLTWKANYEKMGKILKIDLVNKPELALDPKIASNIMFYGMINGSFTGKKLSDYFFKEKQDWVNARRIINGRDRAEQISAYAIKFYAAISTYLV
jgi:predicted chitinase